MYQGVRLSHADRPLYPDAGLTKLAVAQYYAAVADWALPQIAFRPLTLLRSTGARNQRAFYQKHVGPGMPDEIKRFAIAAENGAEPFPLVVDVSGLIALVQIGVVEIHHGVPSTISNGPIASPSTSIPTRGWPGPVSPTRRSRFAMRSPRSGSSA